MSRFIVEIGDCYTGLELPNRIKFGHSVEGDYLSAYNFEDRLYRTESCPTKEFMPTYKIVVLEFDRQHFYNGMYVNGRSSEFDVPLYISNNYNRYSNTIEEFGHNNYELDQEFNIPIEKELNPL